MSDNKPYRLASLEYKRERTVVDVPNSRKQIIRIGGSRIVCIAGPCAVENREQIMEIASAVAASGAVILRGGAYKPRTSPYSFQGLGEEGLKLLKEAGDKFGLPVATEIVDTSLVPIMEKYGVDVYQIGARNMQNFELLKKVGILRKPVIVKRGLSATIEDLLMAAEYLMSSGTEKVILCERGIRTFERATRNTLDLSAIPVLRSLTHLPIIVDPSHAVGIRDKIPPMGLAAIAAGADGIIVEVHCNPEKALSDGPQALLPNQFDKLMHDIEALAPVLGKAIAHIKEISSAPLNSNADKSSDDKKTEKKDHIICAYSGNRGAYAEQAIERYFDSDKIFKQEEPSFSEVFQAVTDGKADYGLIPIENSLAGSVYENYDNLSRFSDVSIVGSITLNIRHALLGVIGGSLESIKNIYSHPQALSQCKKYLEAHPEWKHIEATSTATAAKMVSKLDSQENAAIASPVNASLYKLETLCEDIEDNPGNFTRFVVIKANNSATKYKNSNVTPKTASIIFKTKNEPGALYHCLGVIDEFNLNLSRLESRPIQGEPWKYWFYADIDLSANAETHTEKEVKAHVDSAIETLKRTAEDVRILGIY
ncbi:MAG: 3-deoxy-7-phosphoheptulonate synthase [Treponema sp.]|nr:3-deoxy-7-phosphoheptulonate synthase [Treponema sp.]